MRQSIHPKKLPLVLMLLIGAVICAPAPVWAESLQDQASRIVRSTKLGKATFGLLVTDLATGEDLASMHADQPLIPASNLKLITSAAALSRLGKEHIFSTQLRLDGANLIVHGNGDPAFCDPVVLEEIGLTVDGILDRWVDAVRKSGVAAFDAILIDDRAFDDQFVHPSWPRNQLQHWYCAQVAAINFNDNCLDFYASPTTAGHPPRITLVPDGVPVSLDNKATTGSGKPLGLTRHLGGNRLLVTGRISRALTSPSFVTIHDPPLSFGGLLRERLRKAGIPVADVRRVAPDALPSAGRLLAAVETTLPTVLIRTNRDSQNLFAEALVKHLGHHATGRPGSWDNGLTAIRNFITEAIGAAPESIVLDDGSGLSRKNRVSPRLLVQVMGHMHHDRELGPIYRESLAQPGERGTLRKRLTNGELSGQLYGKSGYINGTITLSGYLVVGQRTIAYSMLLNNYAYGGRDAQRMMEKILIAVDRHYATTAPPLPPSPGLAPAPDIATQEPAIGG